MSTKRNVNYAETRNGMSEINTTRENRRSRQIFFYVVIIVALAVTVALAVFHFFFRVSGISCEGEGKYSQEEIISNSGITQGQSIFFVNEDDVEQRLKNKFPYIESVETELSFPSDVKIKVKYREAAVYLMLKGDCYLLSDDMYVLERVSKDELPEGIIELESAVTSLKTIIVGNKIEFYYEKMADSLSTFFFALKENEVFDLVGKIKANDRFNISMKYGERFDVYVGSVESIDVKIQFLKEIIKKLGDDVEGKIDISSEKNATFSPYGKNNKK